MTFIGIDLGTSAVKAVLVNAGQQVLDIPLRRVADEVAGAAMGAARLARLAVSGDAPDAVCQPPVGDASLFTPNPCMVAAYAEHRALWRIAVQFNREIEQRP